VSTEVFSVELKHGAAIRSPIKSGKKYFRIDVSRSMGQAKYILKVITSGPMPNTEPLMITYFQ
jgi:hypothetical protein